MGHPLSQLRSIEGAEWEIGARILRRAALAQDDIACEIVHIMLRMTNLGNCAHNAQDDIACEIVRMMLRMTDLVDWTICGGVSSALRAGFAGCTLYAVCEPRGDVTLPNG